MSYIIIGFMSYRRKNSAVMQKFKGSITIIFSVFFYTSSAIEVDTTFIDSLTSEAYKNARTNTEWSISIAHQALSASKMMQYQRGMADATLALGSAYLAKYNPNDSADYYYHQSLNEYNQIKDYTGQARACYGLSYLYSFKSMPQKAEAYGNLSVEYFQKAGKDKELIAALGTIIYLAKQSSDYEKALELSDSAIVIARSIKDSLQWADALNNKGNVLKDMFLFNPAIDAYFEAFKLWGLANDTSGLGIAYGSIANAYFFEGDYEKSLEFNFKKLPITKNARNYWETNKAMNNIALAYNNLGKHDSALFYMRESLNIASKLNYPEGVANTYDNIASTFLKTGINDSALFYSSEAVSIAEKINSPNLAKYELSRAKALEQQKKYNIALAIAQKAYNMAKQRNDNHTLRDASFLLNNIYYHLGNRDLAYPFLKEYIKLNDSITNMEFMRKVTRLDIQHEYEKKQKAAVYEIENGKQQIEILNKTNQLKSEKIRVQWLILLALVLFSIAGATISFLIIKNKNHQIGKMSLELQNYLLHESKEILHQNDDKKQNIFQTFIENYGLTQREAEILEHISKGLKNNEIAHKLFVSENTVKFHIKNIYIKLDVKNRIQALQKANSKLS
jgi:DNA-binding CsgD family transcriptional regulator